MHSFVTGTRPDWVAYRALDPELIAWVHTCIPWMIMRVFEQTNRRLTAQKRDRYLAEQAVVGRPGGADAVPTSVAELDEFVAAMRPKLSVNTQIRAFIDFLTSAPIGPQLPATLDRELHRFAIYAGMGRAPRWARELIGHAGPPWLIRQLAKPYLLLDAGAIRWALRTPPCVELARQRAGAAVPADSL